MGERPGERLIEDFGELGTGMRIILRPCKCGLEHRGMIVSQHRDVWTDDGDWAAIAWEMVPSAHDGYRTGIRAETIMQKRVYEQVDQTPEEKSWEKRIKKPRPQFRAPDLSKLKVEMVPGGRRWSPR